MKICPFCKSKKTYFLTKKILEYFVCKNCKTLFVSKIPKFKTVEKFYKESFTQNLLINKNNLIKHYKKILKKLTKINPNGKTLLDIGTGSGLFLKEALKFNLKATGIEPSKYIYSNLKNIKKINIINATFEDFFKKNKNKFDFITMIHVIEHSVNPIQWIKKTAKILNKNGVLFIETPNLNSHLFLIEKENYTFLTPPQHLWIFSVKSFYLILKKIPSIKLLSFSTYSYPEHFVGVLKKIFYLLFYNHKNKKSSLDHNNNNNKLNKRKNYIKIIKYNLIDKFLAPILTPILNLGGFGSILELYINKK